MVKNVWLKEGPFVSEFRKYVVIVACFYLVIMQHAEFWVKNRDCAM